jgi:rubrerythrin
MMINIQENSMKKGQRSRRTRPMNLDDFLNLGIQLEEAICACYEGLSRISSNEDLVWRLAKMAREEKNHARILASGKEYIKMIPDAFGSKLMTGSEIRNGLSLAENLLLKIRQASSPDEGLKELLELERRFEKVHLDTSIEIRDPSLKKLFQDLSKEDKTHIDSLQEVILHQERKR